MAAYTTSSTQKQSTRTGGCHCKEEPAAPCSCCHTACFERPQYHCGHLLSSEDLTLQLRYDIEKNKLRNRSLFGCGVVCGLRLTCDSGCCGSIRIGKGYALDSCGNDLVACETESFRVVDRLREKGWIEGANPAKDPCTTDAAEVEQCPDKRCFYIVACYDEVEDVYETPFQAGCDPKPAACVATRVRERIRFDVMLTAPKCGCGTSAKLSAGGSREVKALEHGALGDYLDIKKDVIEHLIKADPQIPEEACAVICTMKKLFRQALKEHPAQYSCDLLEELKAVECPGANAANPAQMYADAASTLLNLIFRYSMEAELGNLAFDCCEPEDAGCVVLGAVYVENGKLLRVCNTPRQYVWSFPNIWKILQFDLVNAAIAKNSSHKGDQSQPACCPELNFDGELLQQRIAYSRYANSASAGAFPRALDAIRMSAAKNFNFADAANFAPSLLSEVSEKNLNLGVENGGVLDTIGLSTFERDMVAALNRFTLVRPDDRVVAFNVSDKSTERIVVRETGMEAARDPETDNAVFRHDLEARLAERNKQIDALQVSLDETRARLDAMSKNEKKPAPTTGKGDV